MSHFVSGPIRKIVSHLLDDSRPNEINAHMLVDAFFTDGFADGDVG
eukprot:CAMPEP_0119496380 /NCGR_PEP_ID=MMETSP1344-20130328/19736_1 /TAXON_ID=236787 /ORGANISM="Florenciella parvula, Strain CCMP2471" /LENGTH=45 /DNA_ID= /DNA_START= /DNA_END= /DNA_ORIENTATION=